MKRKIAKMGDQLLNKKTRNVTDVNDKEVKKVITDLQDTFNSSNQFTVGISAPQIGYDMAICLCKDIEAEKLYLLINPKILSRSEEQESHIEGCKSVGKGEDGLETVLGHVERAKEIVVQYTDRAGEVKTMKANGFFAAVLQHEVDHLNGRLFVYYIDDPAKLVKRGEYLEKDIII
ncbi:MAG: peptide deformylase [Patescibacteria group bacterium]|nr:peptide deformylase [Patescibacteria group bacterium]